METFLRVTGLCESIHRSPVDSPHKRQRSIDIFFDLLNWAIKRDASDLRRHRAQYDSSVVAIGHPLGRSLQWDNFHAITQQTHYAIITSLLRQNDVILT